ncbi:MAG: sterol desaturase family protein [Gammaproteobacteria bacterium]|nr:sterol desaturase family protein [Gammaproteobacteria bacterium]
MRTLKAFCWFLALLLAATLIALAAWHGQLPHLGAHGTIAWYLLLAVALAIPARFLALAGAYLAELLLVGWPRSSLRMLWKPSASVRMDMVTVVMQLLLPQRHIGYALSFGLLYAIDVGTRHLDHLSLTWLLPTWGLQVLCVILFQSCLRYWMHRLEHVIPAFWALHKFHHSAESLSLLTSTRATELARGIEAGLVFAPAALLTSASAPVPSIHSPWFAVAVIYFVYNTFSAVNGYFVHSNLATDYGWIGRWLLVSPRMHRLHHAKSPSYHDKNFTFDLVLWDRLFGTYAACPPETDPLTIPLGLEENPFNAHDTVAGALREYFLSTYLVFWQELRRGLRAWLPQSPPALPGSSST